MKVPDILLSGDHAKIAEWRRRQALERTKQNQEDRKK
jgi:tRNA (guanine37-N1)-methyltransferase